MNALKKQIRDLTTELTALKNSQKVDDWIKEKVTIEI